MKIKMKENNENERMTTSNFDDLDLSFAVHDLHIQETVSDLIKISIKSPEDLENIIKDKMIQELARALLYDKHVTFERMRSSMLHDADVYRASVYVIDQKTAIMLKKLMPILRELSKAFWHLNTEYLHNSLIDSLQPWRKKC